MEKIAVVTSLYNSDITQKLEEAAIQCLKNSYIQEEKIFKIQVPGVFEIPLAIQWCFEEKKHCGAIALGCLIQGESFHFDRICSHLENGLTELQLTYQKPIGFGVLTTKNKKQALDRLGGNKVNRGEEAAKALLDMLKLKKSLIQKNHDEA